MKTITRMLACAALAVGAASMVVAGPGPQFWQQQTLRSREQFKELKAGDKIAYVCNQCKTVSETTLATTEQAMELCKEGATVACPMCKKTTKVVTKQSRNDPPTRTEVAYVNDKGEECMFIAKASEKK